MVSYITSTNQELKGYQQPNAQTNSTYERHNSTLAQTLRMYWEKDQSNWPELLSSVMMSFRTSPATESISLSPFSMLFGKEMYLPVDTALVPNTQ